METNSTKLVCKKLLVALDPVNLRDCVLGDDIFNVLINCKSVRSRMVYYYLRVIASNYPCCITLGFYACFHFKIINDETDNQTAFWDKILSEQIDIYPYIRVTTEVIKKFHVVTPRETGKYNFYVNTASLEKSLNYLSISFILLPFDYDVWCFTWVVVFLSFIIFITAWQFSKRIQSTTTRDNFRKLVFVLLFVPAALLAAYYGGLLKAQLMDYTIAQPFDSFYDLASLIRSNKSKIVIDHGRTYRQYLLTCPNHPRTHEMQTIYEAVRATLDSLIVETNMSRVCKLMRARPRGFVFFGYDSDAFTSCDNICFWRRPTYYDSTEFFSHIVDKRNKKLGAVADLSMHAMPMYFQTMTSRRYRMWCEPYPKFRATLISAKNMNDVFIFWAIGLAVSTAFFCFEFLASWWFM